LLQKKLKNSAKFEVCEQPLNHAAVVRTDIHPRAAVALHTHQQRHELQEAFWLPALLCSTTLNMKGQAHKETGAWLHIAF
jgi:hypothetical protein